MLKFQIASDVDYENVVAEINHGGQFLCLLSNEHADEPVMIEFPVELPITGPDPLRRIRLDDFIDVINRAKAHLQDCGPVSHHSLNAGTHRA